MWCIPSTKRKRQPIQGARFKCFLAKPTKSPQSSIVAAVSYVVRRALRTDNTVVRCLLCVKRRLLLGYGGRAEQLQQRKAKFKP